MIPVADATGRDISPSELAALVTRNALQQATSA